MQALTHSLNAQLVSTRHSETLLVNEMTQQLAGENRRVYRFGFGQSPFPVPEFVVASLRENAAAKAYAPVQGIADLRRAVAEFHTSIDGVSWDADRVLIGAGSKILLYCLLAAVRSANVILVSPSWVSYEPQALLAGHRVTRVVTTYEENWKLSPEALQRACDNLDDEQTRFLILNSPGNPNGASYSEEQLAALAAVARRNNVIVISDEIYGLLHHRGEHISLARHYPEACIVTGGLSKWCGAGGWRLGISHIPAELGGSYLQRVTGVASETFSCVSTPVQLAAISAYSNHAALTDFLHKQRTILGDAGLRCAARLRAAGVNVNDPEGGFYLFPDFSPFRTQLGRRSITTAESLCERLLHETGVALLPGSAFGMPPGNLTARLAFVDFDGDLALKREQADITHVLEGIERLCEWLEGGKVEA